MFKKAWQLAVLLCNGIHAEAARISTRERSKDDRGELVYIDADQSLFSKPLAAPYCVRPYHVPTVSTPLSWDKVGPELDRFDFTIDNIHDRIAQKGDKSWCAKAIVKTYSIFVLMYGLKKGYI